MRRTLKSMFFAQLGKKKSAAKTAAAQANGAKGGRPRKPSTNAKAEKI